MQVRSLSDLLNPEGAHGCGTLFLKSFLEKVLNKRQLNDTSLSHTDIIKEIVIDSERRIDIVIKNTCFFIPIEVKIYASEQNGQCYDYYEYAKTVDSNASIVYLTLFGNMPSLYRIRLGKPCLTDGVFSRFSVIISFENIDFLCIFRIFVANL